MILRRRSISLWLVAATLTVAVPACTDTSAEPAAKATRTTPPPPPDLSITPAADARDVPISAEIGTTVTGGKVAEVVVTDDKGAAVAGTMRPDGTSWVPDRALVHRRTYDVRVTARGDAGQTTTRNTRFTDCVYYPNI